MQRGRMQVADPGNVYVRESRAWDWTMGVFIVLIFLVTVASLVLDSINTNEIEEIETRLCKGCAANDLCGTGLDCHSNQVLGGGCPRFQLPDGTTCTTTNCFVSAINKTGPVTTGTCASGTCVGGVCLGSCNTVGDCPSGTTLGIVDSTGSSIINSTATQCNRKVCQYQIYNNVTAIAQGLAGPCLTNNAAMDFCLNFAQSSPYFGCLAASACNSNNATGSSTTVTCVLEFACAKSVFS